RAEGRGRGGDHYVLDRGAGGLVGDPGGVRAPDEEELADYSRAVRARHVVVRPGARRQIDWRGGRSVVASRESRLELRHLERVEIHHVDRLVGAVGHVITLGGLVDLSKVERVDDRTADPWYLHGGPELRDAAGRAVRSPSVH